MCRPVLAIALLLVHLSFFSSMLYAQETKEVKDTFFLAKKKGLLGKLGKSLNTEPGNDVLPIKIVNPFIIQTGKIIRNIRMVRLGFERNINDTTIIKYNLGVIVANGLHKKTTFKIINNNLFFKEGDKVHPYLLADNERHLREQVYIQDARILIDSIQGTADSVDVVVITKDVFPVGGAADIGGPTQIAIQVKNENLGGTGSRLSLSTMFDKDRNPKFGYDVSFLKRNIAGSFIDWGVGVTTYRNAFNSGRKEENYFFTHFEKPLVTPYIPWIGALDISFNKTYNAYIKDSLYTSDYKYDYRNVDGWFGYNFGSQRLLYKNMQTRVRKFIALRMMSLEFSEIPEINKEKYDYRYANVKGMLTAFSVFKQEAYRSNFIYGFGRNEDIPVGFSASFITGFTKKENRNRGYVGMEALRSHFSNKGFYSTYTFKMGGYMHKNSVEDIDILLNIDHFTRLRKMNKYWFSRTFFTAGFSKQFKPLLNAPLNINSVYGLPYFRANLGPSDLRTTMRVESVFFNMKKFYGFRFAPFVFGDMSMLTPTHRSLDKSDLYSAIGAGVRTRNENLTFGTIELRGYYFPRSVGRMENYKIEVNTNIRFKFNSTFIRKPDFVVPN